MASERILRHKAFDRLLHWISAASVLTLLATGLLPVLGVDFDWITIHWVAGIVFIAAVLVHIVRASFWQHLGSMAIGLKDFGGLSAELGFDAGW